MALLNNTIDETIVKKTVWLLIAVALNAMEFFIPRVPFFPWLKPGFANIITIIWIIEFGVLDSLLYSLLRIWTVGFFFGFSFLTISLATSGGILSTLAMAITWNTLGKRGFLGCLGIGIIGAFFHNIGQLCTVYWIMSANAHLLYQLPFMLAASVLFGGIIGLLAPGMRTFLLAQPFLQPTGSTADPRILKATRTQYFFSTMLLLGSFGLVFINNPVILLACAVGISACVQIQCSWSASALFKPIRAFWMFFLFIAIINIFFSYGTRLDHFGFITREGVDCTVQQWLRLWTWLEMSYLFSYFKFHAVLFSILKKLFPKHQSTLVAGILCLEYFPAIAEDGRNLVKKGLRMFRKNPKAVAHAFLAKNPGGSNTVLPGLFTVIQSMHAMVTKRLLMQK